MHTLQHINVQDRDAMRILQHTVYALTCPCTCTCSVKTTFLITYVYKPYWLRTSHFPHFLLMHACIIKIHIAIPADQLLRYQCVYLFTNVWLLTGVCICVVGEGVQWSNLNRPVSIDDNLSFLDILLMFLVDIVMYLVLMWYVEAVFPGSYGVPRRWYFPFQVWFWLFNC